MKRLAKIQLALKSPKDQRNNFGKYNYRKASDILQAVKPLLEADCLTILLNDEIKEIGGKFFLIATASLYDGEGKEIAKTTAYAETSPHAGMSSEQATGSASSYARKYALCGLLAIDDSTDDPDSMDNSKSNTHAPATTQNPAKKQSPLMAKISAATNAETINALMEEVKSSSKEEQAVFIEKTTQLKLTFNQKTKQYEAL